MAVSRANHLATGDESGCFLAREGPPRPADGPHLGRKLAWLDGIVRRKPAVRLPVVLSREEVAAVLGRLHGTSWIMASLLYGSGLRLLECCRLRVKDVDLGRGELTMRDGKGRKDRVTLLLDTSRGALTVHLAQVRQQHEADVRAGGGSVKLPHALRVKYPRAAWDWS